MQAVKEKLQDMNTMRKVKAEAKAEEKAIVRSLPAGSEADKDLVKARKEIAHEVRKAKEAEAAMDLHVTKAGEKAEKEIAKHASMHPTAAAGPGAVGPTHNASTMGSVANDPTYTAR